MKEAIALFVVLFGVQILAVLQHEDSIVDSCLADQNVTLLNGTKINCSLPTDGTAK